MAEAIAVQPPTCPISAAGGTSKHKLVNMCDRKLAFKIRSSNNSNYKVSMVFGIIQAGYDQEIVITRVKGPPKADKLVVQYADVEQSCRDPTLPFKDESKIVGEITGQVVIKLSAAE